MADLFERQKEILVSDPYQDAIGEDLSRQLEHLEGAIWVDKTTEGNIPFLVVMPARYLNFKRQAALYAPFLNCPINLDECWEDPKQEIPLNLYVVNDVDLGQTYARKSLDETLAAIASLGRRPMTLPEGIALMRYFGPELQALTFEFPGSLTHEGPDSCVAIVSDRSSMARTICIENTRAIGSWLVPSVKARRMHE